MDCFVSFCNNWIFLFISKSQIDKVPDSVADANIVELNGDQQQSTIVSLYLMKLMLILD